MSWHLIPPIRKTISPGFFKLCRYTINYTLPVLLEDHVIGKQFRLHSYMRRAVQKWWDSTLLNFGMNWVKVTSKVTEKVQILLPDNC